MRELSRPSMRTHSGQAETAMYDLPMLGNKQQWVVHRRRRCGLQGPSSAHVEPVGDVPLHLGRALIQVVAGVLRQGWAAEAAHLGGRVFQARSCRLELAAPAPTGANELYAQGPTSQRL